MEARAYRPKVFNISRKIRAQLYPGDTLIRFVYKSGSSDSTVELLKLVKLSDKENANVPPTLLGCDLFGVYNSEDEDVPDNIYTCLYTNENDDLLRVVHLYQLGNVSAAFFYSKDSVDPTIRYKSDVAKLFTVERPLNLSDTVKIKLR